MNNGKLLRIGIWGASFLIPHCVVAWTRLPWQELSLHYAIMFFASFALPILACEVTQLRDALGGRTSRWNRPTFNARPFAKRSPMQFWWTMDIAFVMAGTAASLRASAHGPESLKWALIWIAAGFGGLIGVLACLRLFGERFQLQDAATMRGGSAVTRRLVSTPPI